MGGILILFYYFEIQKVVLNVYLGLANKQNLNYLGTKPK